MLLVNRFSEKLTKQIFASSSGTTTAVTSTTMSTTTTTLAKEPRDKSRVHKILCFGDSLTAGTSPPNAEYFPYAPYLEQALKDRGLENVVVRHRGMPGWTTQQMLQDLDGERTGLRSAIIGAVKQDPVNALSLVILLAGTNDMAHRSTADEIANNVRTLHQVSYENGVPRTLAIGIPPSGYQSQVPSARLLSQWKLTINWNSLFRKKSRPPTWHPRFLLNEVVKTGLRIPFTFLHEVIGCWQKVWLL
jgi:lysophospholipase L1-like esterase